MTQVGWRPGWLPLWARHKTSVVVCRLQENADPQVASGGEQQMTASQLKRAKKKAAEARKKAEPDVPAATPSETADSAETPSGADRAEDTRTIHKYRCRARPHDARRCPSSSDSRAAPVSRVIYRW